MSAALLVAIADSSLALPSSNQSGLYLSLAEGIHGGDVDNITNIAPSFFSTVCRAVLQGSLDGDSEVLTQVWHCRPAGVNTWASLLLCAMELLGLKTHFAADQ